MSGGSWDYVYLRFEDVAVRLKDDKNIKRRALGFLVEKIANAMYEIEWHDSSDTSGEDEPSAIDNCFDKQIIEKALLERINELKNELIEIEDVIANQK
jgi:hypothetical protein